MGHHSVIGSVIVGVFLIISIGCTVDPGEDLDIGQVDASIKVDAIGSISDGAVPPDVATPDVFTPDIDAAVQCPGGRDPDVCGVCGGDGLLTWYADQDEDGRGDARISVQACEQPDGFVRDDSDRHPECATDDTDICGICAGPGRIQYFADLDGDGLGDPALSVEVCERPDGFVLDSSDLEPECASNDTDICGLCGGPGEGTFFADTDDDGLGDPAQIELGCVAPEGFVDNADDEEPECATNDTDECDVCAGPGPIHAWGDEDADGLGDPDLAIDVCDLINGLVLNADDLEPGCGTNDTDECGVCAGGNADQDCTGECFGEATLDVCNLCAGGNSGVEPADEDTDGDGLPDACDECPDAAQIPIFIVQWTEVGLFQDESGPYTFQVHIYGNGDFRYQYRSMEPFGATATVGYQLSAEFGVTLSQDNDFVLDQSVVHFEYVAEENRYELDYAQPMNWIEISEFGERLRLDDDGQESVDLGFVFPFADAEYDSVGVNANGLLVFEGQGDFRNGVLPTGGFGAAMAPFWDDLNPSQGEGAIYAFSARPSCEEDCGGELGGFAYTDACGLCVGGNTGRHPSENVDCHGDCDGEAIVDECGRCVGGNTGLNPLEQEACLPDLIVVEEYTRQTAEISYIDVQDGCLVQEGCVRGLGRRKILRFGTRIANIGPSDLQLGQPREGVDHWVFDQCHQHYHYEAYAAYDLHDLSTDEVIPIGAKSGFSVIDIGVYDPELAPNGCVGYNGRNQGITSGCQDTYTRSLLCQWIDITDIDDGAYELIVTTNPDGVIPEMSLENNAVRIPFQMQGDDLIIRDEP